MSNHFNRQRHQLLNPCLTPDQLHHWVRYFTGLHVPRTNVCPHHAAPFEYLRRAYFEPASDLVIWAPRGGGKTRLAAVATLLDLLHKPGCAVRILGGSLEQSLRMWEHLLPNLQHVAKEEIIGRVGASRRITLKCGSTAAVLTQSQRAVRGLRVQKLRCDEVELFRPEVWEAAALVTKSRVQNRVSGVGVRVSGKDKDPTPVLLHPNSDTRNPNPDLISGAVEAISTLHRPFGLMHRIVEQAEAIGTPVIRWCLLDVLEKCPPKRQCSTCALWDECQGIAKIKCDGFLRIDDAIAMKRRVSRETWDAEMLCRRPSVRGCVFPSFDVGVHVRERMQGQGVRGEGQANAENASTSASCLAPCPSPLAPISLAIDFGFANPFVCLWIADDGNVCHVIDEYVQEQRTIDDHIEQIRTRPYGAVTRIACDPSGAGRNDQTAASNVMVLRRSGFTVRTRGSSIVEGLEMIRAGLRPAAGEPTLFIHPRCKRLIRALQSYQYADGGSELPIKDGEHDHPIDALRYFYVNRRGFRVEGGRRY